MMEDSGLPKQLAQLSSSLRRCAAGVLATPQPSSAPWEARCQACACCPLRCAPPPLGWAAPTSARPPARPPTRPPRRETTSLAITQQLHQALRQAQSPLSFIRQAAWQQIGALLEVHLADAGKAGPVLEALLAASCWDVILRSLRGALGSVGEPGYGAVESGAASPHATKEQELVALLAVVQVRGAGRPGGCDCGFPLWQLLATAS